MAIGCQQHTLKQWFGFDDGSISNMDPQALEWWQVWKPLLQQITAL
jgi:hypothetical protein